MDEIIRNLLPEESYKLRNEFEGIQRAKERAVADSNFGQAAALRDKADSMKDQLRQMSQAVAIDVQPRDILQAISNLGFDEVIDL